MARVMGLPLVLFLLLTWDGATAANVFSVRCEGGVPVRPYFATFDVDAKAVVFETPPLNVETYSGINVHAGEITSAGNGRDGKIEFMVRVNPGRIDLIFDRDRKTMTWPGFDNGIFRSTLVHQCTVTPPRSMLSFRVRDPIQNPISVRCEDRGAVYFTMDAVSKKVLFDRGSQARGYEGEVTDVRQDEMVLSIKYDVPRQIIWNRSRQTITIDGDGSQPRTVMQCREITPRTMMVYHERLWRR